MDDTTRVLDAYEAAAKAMEGLLATYDANTDRHNWGWDLEQAVRLARESLARLRETVPA